MKPKVISIENAKKLQELGVKADSRDYYCGAKPALLPEAMTLGGIFPIPAYTVGELGEMLPENTRTTKWYSCYSCAFKNPDAPEDGRHKKSKSEADARAKMLIWLIENGHVKAEELL